MTSFNNLFNTDLVIDENNNNATADLTVIKNTKQNNSIKSNKC